MPRDIRNLMVDNGETISSHRKSFTFSAIVPLSLSLLYALLLVCASRPFMRIPTSLSNVGLHYHLTEGHGQPLHPSRIPCSYNDHNVNNLTHIIWVSCALYHNRHVRLPKADNIIYPEHVVRPQHLVGPYLGRVLHHPACQTIQPHVQ